MSHAAQSTSLEQPLPLLLRIGRVISVTGLGRSTIYRLTAAQQFPAPVKLSARAVAWRRADIERWSEARPTASPIHQALDRR